MKNSFQHYKNFISGLLALLLAALITLVLTRFALNLPGNSEQIVAKAYVLFMLIVLLPGGIYFVIKRNTINPWKLSKIFLSSLIIVLVGIYLFTVKDQINFQADFLIWSESDFVNDILKFRAGYPLYTDQLNNESFVYPPGSQLVTYFIASILGFNIDIPVYRIIQLGFTLITAFFAFACVIKIVQIQGKTEAIGNLSTKNISTWAFLGIPFLFLFASNSLTNPFVHLLHNDALAQLITVIAFWLLFGYIQNREKKWLFWMAILPAAGFLVKQNLVVWAFFYCAYLLFFDQSRSIKRLILFGSISVGLVILVIAGGYLLYGYPFYYWVIKVLGAHGVSPLRSFQHLLDVWLYIILGLSGGLLLVKGKNLKSFIGPWLIWLVLMMIQIYTSGVAWMINHIGSACLISGIWFLATIMIIGSKQETGFDELSIQLQTTKNLGRFQEFFQAGTVIFMAVMLLAGLGFFRTPISNLPPDAERYRKAIEENIIEKEISTTLLDAGTWVYLEQGVVMKDRAPSIGERGYSQTGDFSALISRVQNKEYSRIFLRNFHSPDFWYDHFLWDQSSNIRQTLLENYQEVGNIPAVIDGKNYLFSEISILEPKKD